MSRLSPAPGAPPDRAIRCALLIGAAALVWRLIYLALISRAACLPINMAPISDMEAFHRWALQLASGDWLDRAHFHPFHPWQTMVADKSQWDVWYGAVYHQEPFYPYLIALIYLVAPREPSSVIFVQMLLGAAACSFIYLGARRIMPEPAALLAGGLAALYGPDLYYGSLLLRDTALIPIHAALLWVLLEARHRLDEGGPGRWYGAAGLLCGLSYVTKASVLPFVLVMLALTVRDARRLPSRRMAPVLLMLAGCIVPPALVAARNVAVGAPVLSITTRGPIEFINGNHLGYLGTGWFDGEPEVGRYARAVLARTDDRLAPTMLAVVRDGLQQPGAFAALQLRKAGYFVAPFEMPNNASYAYFRHNSWLLRHGALSFFTISPLALLGLIVSVRRRERFVPVYLFVGCGALATIAFYVIARFRAPLMPAILMFAGLGLYTLLDLARRRDWGRFLMAAAAVAAALACNAATNFPDEKLIRPQDHLVAITAYRASGQTQRALDEAQEAWARFPTFAPFPRHAGDLLLEQGRRAEALAAYRATLDLNPGDAEARRLASQLERMP